jgi:hypothetical protein
MSFASAEGFGPVYPPRATGPQSGHVHGGARANPVRTDDLYERPALSRRTLGLRALIEAPVAARHEKTNVQIDTQMAFPPRGEIGIYSRWSKNSRVIGIMILYQSHLAWRMLALGIIGRPILRSDILAVDPF